MFFRCRALKELDFSNFNTNKLTMLQNIFNGCTSLEKINITNLETSNIIDTQNLFLGCGSLKEIDLRNWDTRNVTIYGGMFQWVKAAIKLGPNWNSNITASNTGYSGTSWNL
jgi:surface protein